MVWDLGLHGPYGRGCGFSGIRVWDSGMHWHVGRGGAGLLWGVREGKLVEMLGGLKKRGSRREEGREVKERGGNVERLKR